MYFQNYRLRKMWLDKCLKSPVSEDRSKNSMEKGPKHCSNINHSTFSLFIDKCEGNSVEKSLSE